MTDRDTGNDAVRAQCWGIAQEHLPEHAENPRVVGALQAAYNRGAADARAEEKQKLVGISEEECPCSPCHAKRAIRARKEQR